MRQWDRVAETAQTEPGNGRVCRNEARIPRKAKPRGRRWYKRFLRWRLREAARIAKQRKVSLQHVLDTERWSRYE